MTDTAAQVMDADDLALWARTHSSIHYDEANDIDCLMVSKIDLDQIIKGKVLLPAAEYQRMKADYESAVVALHKKTWEARELAQRLRGVVEGVSVENLKAIQNALECLDAIISGEVRQDWSDYFGADFEVYLKGKMLIEQWLTKLQPASGEKK
jgi:hypothetical protein